MKRENRIRLKAFLSTAFLLVGLLFVAHKAEASCTVGATSCMNEWYSSSNANGNFIDGSTLQVRKEAVAGNGVQLGIVINPISTAPHPQADPADARTLNHFVYTNNSEGTGQPVGKIDVTDGPTGNGILGSWASLYDYDDLSPDMGEGVWIEVAKKSEMSTGCLNDAATIDIDVNAYVSSGCFNVPSVKRLPLIYYLLTKDSGGNLPMVKNVFDTSHALSVRVNGLDSETDYVARIRIEENGSPDAASSKLLSFKTAAAGTANLTQQGVQQNTSGGATDGETGLPECSIIGTSSWMGCVAQTVYYIIFKPTAWVMVLAGEIMDWGIGYSIDSSSYPVSGHSFVTDGWRIMRDLANMFFIFILVIVAINTILGNDNKKVIAWVLIIALVINFSLFLCKVVVDVGNITSRFFYNNISITSSQANNAEIIGTAGHKSISYGFAATFNPVKLFANITPKSTINTSGGTTAVDMSPTQFAGFFAIFSFIGGAINLIAAFVFFSMAWLFIARTVGLWIAMIFGPIAFVSLAMPSGSIKMEAAKDAGKYLNFKPWWSNLTSLAIMPLPAMLMIFLILAFLKSNFLGNIPNETTTGQFIGVIVPLIIVGYLLLLTKTIAKSFAGDFGETMSKVGNWVGGAVVGAATGGAAFIGRKTIGYAATRAAESSRLKNYASRSIVGRSILKGARSVGNSTFDARNIKVNGKDVGQMTGFGVGKVESKGYSEDLRNKRKEQKKFADSLGANEIEKRRLKQLQNEAKRKAMLRARNEKDPYTGKVPSEDEVKAAQNIAKKEEDRLKSENDKRRENYAQAVEQGTNPARAVVNKVTRMMNKNKDPRLLQKEIDVAQAKADSLAKKLAAGDKDVTQTDVDNAQKEVTKLKYKMSQRETGQVGSFDNTTAEEIRNKTKDKKKAKEGDSQSVVDATVDELKDENKKLKDELMEEMKKMAGGGGGGNSGGGNSGGGGGNNSGGGNKNYGNTGMGFAPNQNNPSNTNQNNPQSKPQNGPIGFRMQTNANSSMQSMGNTNFVKSGPSNSGGQMSNIQNLGGVDDYKKFNSNAIGNNQNTQNANTSQINSNSPINITNSSINITTSGGVNTGASAGTATNERPTIGFRREAEAPREAPANERKIGFTFSNAEPVKAPSAPVRPGSIETNNQAGFLRKTDEEIQKETEPRQIGFTFGNKEEEEKQPAPAPAAAPAPTEATSTPPVSNPAPVPPQN